MRITRRVIAVVAGLIISGCGGAGGRAVPAASTPQQTASVSITLVVPNARGTASASRSPRYVSAATSSVRIVVNGGTPQTFAVGTAHASCWPPQPNAVCSVFNIDAPAGNDTFAVTLLDAAGNALSTVTTTAAIALGQANVLHFAADGVVASLAVSTAGAAPAPGTATTRRIDVVALDADGYIIVGMLPPITVTDTDPSGATALFLATDSTCGTPTTAPSGSVTLTQSNGAFPTVCLTYTGGAMSSPATLTASTSGVAAATTRFQATSSHASGVWAFGTVNGATALAKIDANLNVTQQISGSATGLSSSTQVVGMDVDASQRVSLLSPQTGTAFTIATFDGTQSGNVPPVSTTSFTLALRQVNITGPALDRHGGAYVMGIGSDSTQVSCAIYYVPLNGGTAIPTQVYDCTADSGVASALQGFALHTSPSGDLWAGFDNTSHIPTGKLYRYVNGPSGLTPAGSAQTVNVDAFAFFPDGNAIVCRGGLGVAVRYTIATTASTFTATPGSIYDAECPGAAADATGNGYISSGQTYFYPPGTTTHTNTTTAVHGAILAGYVGP